MRSSSTMLSVVPKPKRAPSRKRILFVTDTLAAVNFETGIRQLRQIGFRFSLAVEEDMRWAS